MKEKISVFENFLGDYYRSRDELLFKCPFCEHHKKKLSINIKLNVFKCWVCNSRGGLSYLVKRFASQEDKRFWNTVTQTVDMTNEEFLFIREKEKDQVIDLPKEFICLGNKDLPPHSKEPLAYLTERGLRREDIIRYKLGYCHTGDYKNRIIFPSFNENGDCNFFIARSYIGNWFKYKNPPASSKTIIFNDLLVDWSSPVVLVEGAFDAVKTENSIPVLGSTLSTESKLFQKLVSNCSQIYIGFDQDAITKTLNIASDLLQFDLEVFRIDTSEIEDLGSISKRQVSELVKSSKPVTFESLIDLQWRKHA